MASNIDDQDKELLEILRQQRILLLRIGVQRKGSERSFRASLKRLSPYVESESPYDGFTYYRLTKPGARLVGVHEEVTLPPQRQALQRLVGIQSFCFLTDPPRWRYTRPDFTADYPRLAAELGNEREYYLDYYLDRAGDTTRLGEVIVDHGAECPRIVQKLHGRLRQYVRDFPGLRELIESDLFCFAVVVPSEEKRDALEDTLRRRPPRSHVRVACCPELGQLFTAS